MKSEKKILLLAFLAYSPLFCFASTYSRILTSLPINLSPHKLEDNNSQHIMRQVSDSLVLYDGNTLVPGLAKSWKIGPNGLKYSFILRDDIFFSDGNKITVKDVISSFLSLMKAESVLSNSLKVIEGVTAYLENKARSVKGVRAIGKNKVQIVLKSPYPPFIHLIASVQMSILNKRSIKRLRDLKLAAFPSSGPYTIEKVEKKRIVLKRNPYYYKRKHVFFKRVSYQVIVDLNVAIELFKKSKVQDIWPYHVPEGLIENLNLQKISSYTPVSWYLLINLKKDRLNSLPIRQFLRENFDKKLFLKNMGLPQRYIQYGIIPKGLAGHISREEILRGSDLKVFDITKHCSLLRPCKFTILTPYGNASLISKSFSLMGKKHPFVKIESFNMERHQWYKKFKSSDYQITLVGNNSHYPDAYSFLQYLIRENYHPGLNSVKIKALLGKSLNEKSKYRRKIFYQKIEKDLYNQVGIIPIYSGLKPHVAVDGKIKGFKLGILGFPSLRISDLYY